MAEDKLSSRISSVLLSGRADETLAYSKHIKDYETGKSVKQDLEERVKKTDQLVTDQLADSSVTTSKLADKSITNDKLDDKVVTTPKLQDSSVTTEKLNDHAVTTEKVADKSITNPKLADNSVDSRVIKSESVDTHHLANESVTTEKVKDQAITNDKMADGTLKIDKLDPELRKSIQAATGLPDNLVEMIQNVDESIKTLHDNDTNLQDQLNDHQAQIGSNDSDIAALQDRSTQMEQSIKDIAVSGGASTANAVSYDNSVSGLDSVTAQDAIDKLAAKDKEHDAEIAKKANASDINSKMQTEQERVNTELDKKFDKEDIAQELGDSEDKVVSQSALPFRVEESEEWAYLIKDAEDHILLGIQQDGSVEWSAGIPAPIRAKLSEIISQTQQDKEDLSTKIDEINDSIQVILNEKLETKVDKEEGKSLIDDEVKERFEVIENEEFLEAKVDAEEKVLEGITSDGKKQINLPTTVPSVTIKGAAETTSMENEEFLDLKVDRENHILEGITRDGEKVLPLPITGNPTINEMKQEIANVKEQAKRSYLEIEFDEATGDINAILGDNSTITDVTTDDDGNIYLEEDITTSSEPETMTKLASVDETKETAIFNK